MSNHAWDRHIWWRSFRAFILPGYNVGNSAQTLGFCNSAMHSFCSRGENWALRRSPFFRAQTLWNSLPAIMEPTTAVVRGGKRSLRARIVELGTPCYDPLTKDRLYWYWYPDSPPKTVELGTPCYDPLTKDPEANCLYW